MVAKLFSSIFFCIVSFVKLINFTANKTIKLTILSLSNKYTRTLIILSIIGLLFSQSLWIIASVYFIYLTYDVMNNKGILRVLNKKINLKLSSLRSKYEILHKLSKIDCNKILLNNILLEDDTGIFKLNYLVLTEKAIYNLIPLSSAEEVLITELKNTKFNTYKKVSQFNNINNLIEESLPVRLPQINIFLTQRESCIITLEDGNIINLMTMDQLIKLVENNENRSYKIPLKELRNSILENKLWFLDKIFLWLSKAFSKDILLTLFFIAIPLIYFIYITVILSFNNFIQYILQSASNYFTSLLH